MKYRKTIEVFTFKIKNIRVMVCLVIMMLSLVACDMTDFPIGANDNYQEIAIARRSDSISLDPATATDLETFQVTANIFENLVRTDSNGIDILPGLAETWEVTEDGLTFVFKLRKDVKFHDNSEFNAEAVVFNFNRWMDKESPYHIGQFTYWNQSFGGNPGMIKSISALSGDTVEVVLNEPYTPFLSVISMPAFGIASPSAIVKYNENLNIHPVGTGPFKLESWDEDGEIVLVRNEDYDGDKGTITKVTYKTLDISDNYVQMLQNGDIHIMNQITEDDITSIRASNLIDVVYIPFLNVSYLAINHQKDPFNNLEVRQAIAKVIDKEEMIKVSYGVLSRPAYSFLPPTLNGYDEGFKNVEYDIIMAKKILSKAGYENGFKTSIWVMDQPRNYFPNPELVAYYISDKLALIGIDAEVITIDWGKYTDILSIGEHDMALIGWHGDFVDPDNFLYTMFYSANTEEGTVLNYSFYSNPDVDDALRKARRVADDDFRAFIYRDIQKKLYEEMASIPLAHTMNAMAISKKLVGFKPSISGIINVNELEVKDETID